MDQSLVRKFEAFGSTKNTTMISTSTTRNSITNRQDSNTQATVAKTDDNLEEWMAQMESKYQRANDRIREFCKNNMKELQGSLSTKTLKEYVNFIINLV